MHTASLSAWRREVGGMLTRQVEKVELCSGKNEIGQRLRNYDSHTFLRAFLAPTEQLSREVVLIERIKSSDGAYHSVVPNTDVLPAGGDVSRTDVLDRVCVVRLGLIKDVVRKFEVERTLEFNGDLSVQELAIILGFIANKTKLVCARVGCANLSRSFAFTCLAALAPALPPSMKQHTAKSRIKEMCAVSREAMFEENAKDFLAQLPWMARDTEIALQLVHARRQE